VLRAPEDLYELLDPDVLWYSTTVDSSCTCNGADDVAACIRRNVARGLTGRWELLGEHGDAIVVRPVFDPPRPSEELCVVMRGGDGLIVEMRDFRSRDHALRYAGVA